MRKKEEKKKGVFCVFAVFRVDWEDAKDVFFLFLPFTHTRMVPLNESNISIAAGLFPIPGKVVI